MSAIINGERRIHCMGEGGCRTFKDERKIVYPVLFVVCFGTYVLDVLKPETELQMGCLYQMAFLCQSDNLLFL